MEKSIMLPLGILIAILGIVNMSGNISTIHSYNRRKVREEDIPKYGRTVGAGTLNIGLTVTASFFLELAQLPDTAEWVALAGILSGLSIALYGQFKYNKGIF